MKIRIGNDFVFNWAIERGGLPEDLSSVLEKHLYLSVFGKRVELIEGVDYDITGNVIRIEVTPAIANIIGTYKAEFHYILPDNGLIDEDRKCAVDVDAFQIVAKTAQADDSTEFSMTSDMAIAFKGDKGDSAYQVWLEEGNTGTEEDYFAYLRQPAVDAGASISELEGEIQVNEGLRVQAESERVQAESERQVTIQEAVTATQEAITAATLADTARLAIQDDLALKADHGYDSSPKTLKEVDDDLAQLESKTTPLNNLIRNSTVNGDFSKGLDNWYFGENVSNYSVANNILTFTGVGSNNNGANHVRNIDVGLPRDHIIYVSVVAKVVSGNRNLYVGVSYDATRFGGISEEFNRYSYRGYSPNTNPQRPVVTASGTVQITQMLSIDLTDAFGEGFEPPIEVMDSIIDSYDWFDDTILLSPGLLKLIGIESGNEGIEQRYHELFISSVVDPIVVDMVREEINFSDALTIRHESNVYNISMDQDFIYSYTASDAITICFDISKLSGIVSLSNDCFHTYSQTSAILNNNHVPIILIPYKGAEKNILPRASFDFVLDYEKNRTAMFADSFEIHTPTVNSLKSDDEDAIIDANAFNQLSIFLSKWDELTERANRFMPDKPYMTKCWIDGTPYDSTSKCMSSLPTSGSHNINDDLNQYELLMYKFIPDTYDGFLTSTDLFKPPSKKILVISGVHGPTSDHWESPIAWYYVMNKLVKEFYVSNTFTSIRNQLEIHIIPAANPWGLNNRRRENGQNTDINRDMVNLQSNEAQFITTLINSKEYDIVVDSHCLGGTTLNSTNARYHFKSTNRRIIQLARQVLNYMRARYEVGVLGGMAGSVSGAISTYSRDVGQDFVLLEMYANAERYWGDTEGDVHSKEAVERCVVFCQNVLSILSAFVSKLS